MEVAPFFVEFHNLRTFVAIYIMSNLRTFSAIFFGQNNLLRNITRFLHVCNHHHHIRHDHHWTPWMGVSLVIIALQ